MAEQRQPPLVQFKLEDNSIVYVEAASTANEPDSQLISLGDQVFAATKKLEEAFEPLAMVASKLVNKLRTISDRPDTIGVTFGIKLSTSANLIICGTAEASYTVKLIWSPN